MSKEHTLRAAVIQDKHVHTEVLEALVAEHGADIAQRARTGGHADEIAVEKTPCRRDLPQGPDPQVDADDGCNGRCRRGRIGPHAVCSRGRFVSLGEGIACADCEEDNCKGGKDSSALSICPRLSASWDLLEDKPCGSA